MYSFHSSIASHTLDVRKLKFSSLWNLRYSVFMSDEIDNNDTIQTSEYISYYLYFHTNDELRISRYLSK